MALEPHTTSETVSLPVGGTSAPASRHERSDTETTEVPDVSHIRRIVAHDPVAVDPFARLQAMWIYRFYKKNLQKYGWIRQVVRVLWGMGYSVYHGYAARRLSSGWRKQPWRPLVRYSDYVAEAPAEPHVLAASAVVDTPAPRVLPQQDQDYLIAPHPRFTFPEVTVCMIGQATVHGGTNMVFVDDAVICHDLYDFERDSTSEELHGRMLMDVRRRRIKVRKQEMAERIGEAAVFLDACAANYAHWMTEVLPRIALFCAEERFRDVPLIVNDGLHPNILASLLQVAGPGRQVIALAIGCALQVERLHVTSPGGYVPFERRRGAPADGHSHGIFSPPAFAAVRQAVLGQRDAGVPSRKIYLRRNSGVRKVRNADAIETALTRIGFEVVEPEKLTFREQAEVFADATVIVGSTGAAFANLLFTRPGTRVYIMISKQPGTSYWYWQNMACATGGQVNYMLGEPEGVGGIHADFRVDFDAMLASEGGML